LATAKRGKGKAGKSDRQVACAPGASGRPKAGARKLRLERIRKEIEKGTYETEGKVRIAISRLIDDVLAKRSRERR